MAKEHFNREKTHVNVVSHICVKFYFPLSHNTNPKSISYL